MGRKRFSREEKKKKSTRESLPTEGQTQTWYKRSRLYKEVQMRNVMMRKTRRPIPPQRPHGGQRALIHTDSSDVDNKSKHALNTSHLLMTESVPHLRNALNSKAIAARVRSGLASGSRRKRLFNVLCVPFNTPLKRSQCDGSTQLRMVGTFLGGKCIRNR